jgi:hypothetical protein
MCVIEVTGINTLTHTHTQEDPQGGKPGKMELELCIEIDGVSDDEDGETPVHTAPRSPTSEHAEDEEAKVSM